MTPEPPNANVFNCTECGNTVTRHEREVVGDNPCPECDCPMTAVAVAPKETDAFDRKIKCMGCKFVIPIGSSFPPTRPTCPKCKERKMTFVSTRREDDPDFKAKESEHTLDGFERTRAPKYYPEATESEHVEIYEENGERIPELVTSEDDESDDEDLGIARLADESAEFQIEDDLEVPEPKGDFELEDPNFELSVETNLRELSKEEREELLDALRMNVERRVETINGIRTCPAKDDPEIVAEADIEYDHEYSLGDDTDWTGLPGDAIPIAENDTHVKIALLDSTPRDTVHAEKEALRQNEWESVEEFREDVQWE